MSDLRGHRAVTAVVVPGPGPARWPGVADRHWPDRLELDHPEVRAQLPVGAIYLRPHAADECECTSALGAAEAVQHADEKDARQVRALRLRGWSDAKVQRWLEQRAKAEDPQALVRRREAELDAWTAALHDLLGEGGCAEVGLLVHAYRTGLTRDGGLVRAQVRRPRRDLDRRALAELAPDVLTFFVS
jgi:hypothetical protein